MRKKKSLFDRPSTLSFGNVNISTEFLFPNRWDLVAFLLIIGVSALVLVAFQQTMNDSIIFESRNISLDWVNLPEYSLRTVLRMFVAVLTSLLFTFIYGTLAAKNKRAEKVLVPILDILQSVPVLGFISITSLFFLSLAPGKVWGAELIAIFALFTSQAWNMTFSFYQSLKTVPADLSELTRSFRLTVWQRFWKLEVPFAMPGLVRNMMVSMSGGWFFLVAAEVITVGGVTVYLPGIGSFLSLAIDQGNLRAVWYVVIAMAAVIVLYDQLIFRPIVAWADKFKLDSTLTEAAAESWLLNLIRRTRLIRYLFQPVSIVFSFLARLRFSSAHWKANYELSNVISQKQMIYRQPKFLKRSRISFFKNLSSFDLLFNTLVLVSATYLAWHIFFLLWGQISFEEVFNVVLFGMLTMLRVFILVFVASLIWVPIGICVGIHRKLADRVQVFAQILAAFPANVLYPLVVAVIVKFHLNPNIWLSFLMILGAQWYILFNVIAGAVAYPNDFKEVAVSFRIKGWQWWRQAIFPGIFPYFITGAITATGGAWNASIVAESVNWGEHQLFAKGLGAYIAHSTAEGNSAKILLGIVVMSLLVILFNRLFWRPIHIWAETRFRFD